MESSYQFVNLRQPKTVREKRQYILTLVQQPKHSRMCGFGEKVDRRPVDPPAVIQLEIKDTTESEKVSYLYNPYYFMYATLISPSSDEELHLLRDGKTRATTGSNVSSLYRLKDTLNKEGAFFVFPDLSIRMEGSYRLKFSLFEIINSEIYYCASIKSSMFHVYPAKKFPGMEESTQISRCFAEQGLKIRIRRDIRMRKIRTKSDSVSTDRKKKLPGEEDGSDNASGSESDDTKSEKGSVKRLKTHSASQLPPGYPPKYPHDPRFFPPDSVAGAAVPGAPSSYGYYPPSWPPTMYHDPYGPYGRPPVSLPPGYPPGYPPPSSYGRPPPGPGASHSHPPDGCSNLSPKEGSHPAGPGQYNGWSRPPPPPHGYSLPPIYSYDRSLAYDPYGYRPPYDPSTGQPFGGQRPPLINRRRSSGGSELKVVIPKTEGATSTTSRGFPSNSSTPLSDGRSSNPSPTELSRFYPVYAGRISGDNPNAQNVQHDSRQQSRSPNHPGGDRFQQMSANSQDGRPPTPSHENPLMRQNPYAHPYYSYPDGGAGNPPQMKQGLPPRPAMHYYPQGYPYPMPQQGIPPGPHQVPPVYAFNPALPPRQGGHMPGRPPMHLLPPQYASARPPPPGYWTAPEGYPPMDPHRVHPGLEHGHGLQQGMIRHQAPQTHPGQMIPQHPGYPSTVSPTSMMAHQFPIGGQQVRSPGRVSPTHAPQNLEIPRISPVQTHPAQAAMSLGTMAQEHTGPSVIAAPVSSVEQPNPLPGAETGDESPSKLVKTTDGPI